MPLRQQDSVCAQIIPCSSWLFSIFLNRHCTESGIRNGPVISLIASTDKSKMGKFFSKTQLTQTPNAPQGALSLLSHNGVDPPQPALTPGLGKNPNGRTGCPTRQDPCPPGKGQRSEREGQEVEDIMFLGVCPLVTLKLTPRRSHNLPTGESLCYQGLLHPRNIPEGHKQTSHTHIHHSRHRKPAHPISDLTDLNRDWGLSLPNILLEFSKFLLLDMQGNSQVLLIKRWGPRRGSSLISKQCEVQTSSKFDIRRRTLDFRYQPLSKWFPHSVNLICQEYLITVLGELEK